nr:BrnA antitoxin family protein [uncultured Desulfobulbus sp.]
MAKQLPLTDKDGEVRELTKEDFKKFKPASEVLPKELIAVLPKRGRPQTASPKKPVNIRLSDDVLSAFKATGKGWQTRINEALRDWLKENRPA